MTITKAILWIFSVVGIIIFLSFIKKKFVLWRWSRRVRRMAKRYPQESEALNSVADGLLKLSKNTKLEGGEEDDQ